jgi:serine/threonine protein phosphatase PrpC
MALTIEAAGRSHIGLVRARNEDSLYAGQSLFAVADGLGGHTAGDVASSTVIDSLKSHDHLAAPADLPNVLGRAIYSANEELRRTVEAEPALSGMGTTLVALFWSETVSVLANIGDSRAYRVRRASQAETPQFAQLTEDHVYGNLVADAANVPHLPERITRYLDGRAEGRSPDLTIRDLRPGDRFLLCSDGLSGVIPRELIFASLTSGGSPDETADRLLELAIDHGGPDNITVIVIDVDQR